MKQLFSLIISLLVIQSFINAQDLYMPRNIKKAYTNGTRSLTGTPGANYWQNKGVYNIEETIHPDTNQFQEQKKLCIQTTALIL